MPIVEIMQVIKSIFFLTELGFQLEDIDSFKVEQWLKNGVVRPESPFKFTAFQV
jgi:hypothetical protein